MVLLKQNEKLKCVMENKGSVAKMIKMKLQMESIYYWTTGLQIVWIIKIIYVNKNVHVHMCVHVHIYMYIWTKAHTYVQKHEHFHMYKYGHICCTYVKKYTQAHVYVNVDMCINIVCVTHMLLCEYLRLYVFICICTYAYTYLMHTCTPMTVFICVLTCPSLHIYKC